MTLRKLPEWARDLVDASRVARIALLDADDRPRLLPITYAVADEALWSAIDRKPKRTAEPARVRWLRRRPDAAVLVDRYDDDWERLAWVQLLGRIALLDAAAPEAQAGFEALAAKYPQYRAEPPPGPVLRLEVARGLCWRAGG